MVHPQSAGCCFSKYAPHKNCRHGFDSVQPLQSVVLLRSAECTYSYMLLHSVCCSSNADSVNTFAGAGFASLAISEWLLQWWVVQGNWSEQSMNQHIPQCCAAGLAHALVSLSVD